MARRAVSHESHWKLLTVFATAWGFYQQRGDASTDLEVALATARPKVLNQRQGTCVKGPWTKPEGVGLRVGGGWVGLGKVVAGKGKQLYLNNLKN